MSTPFAITFWTAMVLYALAVAGHLYGQSFGKPAWHARATWAVLAGLLLHTTLIAWWWIGTGRAPVVGNFENALVSAWFVVAMTLWAGWRQRLPVLAAAALPFALLLLAFASLSRPAPGPLEASLQSAWLWIHVFFAWLAYGAFTVACGAGVVLLVKTRKGRTPPAELLTRLEELMVSSIVFGFITDAVMLAAGSLWAKKLWGSYWSWDPVETWALLGWLAYGVALHLRRTLGWKGRKLAWVAVGAIVFVLVSAWGVNVVMAGTVHVQNAG